MFVRMQKNTTLNGQGSFVARPSKASSPSPAYHPSSSRRPRKCSWPLWASLNHACLFKHWMLNWGRGKSNTCDIDPFSAAFRKQARQAGQYLASVKIGNSPTSFKWQCPLLTGASYYGCVLKSGTPTIVAFLWIQSQTWYPQRRPAHISWCEHRSGSTRPLVALGICDLCVHEVRVRACAIVAVRNLASNSNNCTNPETHGYIVTWRLRPLFATLKDQLSGGSPFPGRLALGVLPKQRPRKSSGRVPLGLLLSGQKVPPVLLDMVSLGARPSSSPARRSSPCPPWKQSAKRLSFVSKREPTLSHHHWSISLAIMAMRVLCLMFWQDLLSCFQNKDLFARKLLHCRIGFVPNRTECHAVDACCFGG